MDFRLNEEQQQIQETARDFLESRGLTEPARRVMDGEPEAADELWDELASLDYTALTVPLEHGGLGEGMVYLVALLEEAGRAAMPGPFPETAALAAPLLAEAGSEEQKQRLLPEVAEGNLRFSAALYEPGGDPLPGTIAAGASARDGGWDLSGSKTLVPWGPRTDRVIAAVRTREDSEGFDGLSLFVLAADDLTFEPLGSLDRTRPLYRFSLDGISASEEALLGPLHGGGPPLRNALDRLRIAYAAMTVGAAERAVDLSVEHGNERTQFGQPVGRFQAVKHRIVDMWMDLQRARSLVYYAAWALDSDDAEAARAVSQAKAFCSEACLEIFESDIFNHGGMGYTWDHDAHIYLKQAKSWQNYLGSPEAHRERIAEERGL